MTNKERILEMRGALLPNDKEVAAYNQAIDDVADQVSREFPDACAGKDERTVICNVTTIKYSVADRIRILLGRKVTMNLDIKVDREVTVIDTYCHGTVALLFRRASKNDQTPREEAE